MPHLAPDAVKAERPPVRHPTSGRPRDDGSPRPRAPGFARRAAWAPSSRSTTGNHLRVDLWHRRANLSSAPRCSAVGPRSDQVGRVSHPGAGAVEREPLEVGAPGAQSEPSWEWDPAVSATSPRTRRVSPGRHGTARDLHSTNLACQPPANPRTRAQTRFG